MFKLHYIYIYIYISYSETPIQNVINDVLNLICCLGRNLVGGVNCPLVDMDNSLCTAQVAQLLVEPSV